HRRGADRCAQFNLGARCRAESAAHPRLERDRLERGREKSAYLGGAADVGKSVQVRIVLAGPAACVVERKAAAKVVEVEQIDSYSPDARQVHVIIEEAVDVNIRKRAGLGLLRAVVGGPDARTQSG